MSFLLRCPLCGPRDVYEYRFGGEVQKRPEPGSDQRTWGEYLYMRTNVSGVERAWWFHRAGCRRWFQAERDTRTNTVIRSGWPPLGGGALAGGGAGAAPEGVDTSGGEAPPGG